MLARGKHWVDGAPVLLLNSHHDTVRATSNWDTDPFEPVEMDGKLLGLGSNDAGAPLVCLLYIFYWLNERDQSFNLLFLASAERGNFRGKWGSNNLGGNGSGGSSGGWRTYFYGIGCYRTRIKQHWLDVTHMANLVMRLEGKELMHFIRRWMQ